MLLQHEAVTRPRRRKNIAAVVWTITAQPSSPQLMAFLLGMSAFKRLDLARDWTRTAQGCEGDADIVVTQASSERQKTVALTKGTTFV